MSSPAPLPKEIHRSAQRGELQKVVKWLRKGGPVGALCSAKGQAGQDSAETLLHAAAANGQLEVVRELLERGASVDLPSGLGSTALMHAAAFGHLSIVLVLLQHLATPDLQATKGGTALIAAAAQGQEACVKALLRAKADTELISEGDTALQRAEAEGHKAIAKLIRQHTTPPQPATTAPAAPSDAGEPAVGSPASLPLEIFQSARLGELQKVVKWLGKEGLVDALCSDPAAGQLACFLAGSAYGLLHTASANGHLEMVRMLLKRGASVDLQTNLGFTALMSSAGAGHPSILLVLLEHSADPDLQDIFGATALMAAADAGQGACVQALLRAKANTELLDDEGYTALEHAKIQGYTAIAGLIRRHLAAASGGPVAPQATQAEQAAQAARAEAAMEKLLAEEEAEQAKGQGRSKKSKKKKKAGRAAAASFSNASFSSTRARYTLERPSYPLWREPACVAAISADILLSRRCIPSIISLSSASRVCSGPRRRLPTVLARLL